MSVEFSHILVLDDLESEPKTVELQPGEAQRAAIAKRLDLIALDKFKATISVRFLPGRRTLALDGTVQASVIQPCAVSLEPVPATIDDRFAEIQGAPLGAQEALAVFPDHPDFDPEEAEDPEPLEEGAIDLGEIVVQYLSLSLDPYPRAGDAGLSADAPGVEINGPERDPEQSPFGKLNALLDPDRK